MNRSALRQFLHGLVIAAAPLSLAGCGCGTELDQIALTAFDGGTVDGLLFINDAGFLSEGTCLTLCGGAPSLTRICNITTVDGGTMLACHMLIRLPGKLS